MGAVLYLVNFAAGVITVCAAGQSFLLSRSDYRVTQPGVLADSLSSELLLAVQAGRRLRCAGLCLTTPSCTAFRYHERPTKIVDCELWKLLDSGQITSNISSNSSEFYAAVFVEGQSTTELALGSDVSASSTQDVSLFPSVCNPSSACCLPRCAVDGLTRTFWTGAAIIPYDWIAVNLLYDHLIYSVTITNRCDNCCPEQLSEFEVRVGQSTQPDGSGFFNGSLCRHRVGAFSYNCQKETYICPTLLRGTAVSVQHLASPQWAHVIAELSIAGIIL